MYITFLGTCANQTANREGVAFLVGTESDALLVDAGPGIIASLQRLNLKASEIDNLFLTHTHGDHILGFAYFVWNRNFERLGQEAANDLNVFGNATTLDAARTMFENSYPEANFPFRIHYNVLESNDSFVVGNMEVTVVAAIHTIPTLSCIIKQGNELVSYSADSLPNDKLVALSQNASLVIHEGMFTDRSKALSQKVMHSTAADAGSFARMVGGKQLLLVHIAPEFFGKEIELLKEARTTFKGNISIPCDGSIYIV